MLFYIYYSIIISSIHHYWRSKSAS